MDKAEKIKAIQNRDKHYDGQFIFGVKSTKIICKPGCPARIPLEKNIVFFDKMEDYLARAGQLKDFLKLANGFIRAESFSSLAEDGKLLQQALRLTKATTEFASNKNGC